jgi:hypothetical protein
MPEGFWHLTSDLWHLNTTLLRQILSPKHEPRRYARAV